MRLTAKERILLYLLAVSPAKETVEVPPALTQEGVARGSSIDLRHVPQYVRPLVHEGLVRQRQAHVKGIRQRRKVYDLTDAGKMAAIGLRERVKAEVIRVQDETGIREMTVAEALRTTGGKASLLDLIRLSQETGVVDLAPLEAAPSAAFAAMLAAAPRIKMFVGRQRELEVLTREAKGPRIFVVRGVAGIGKSCLAAKACEILRGTRNLYWRRVRPWDTSLSILAGLGDFLSVLGRPGLHSILSRGETGRAAEVLLQDLPGTQSFLVFDDVHEASKEALGAFRILKESIAEAEDVRAVFLTRRTLPFYDRRDAVLAGVIREMDLEGLDSSDMAVLLRTEEEGPQLAKLARQFGGHPLLLELLRSIGPSPTAISRLTDVQQFIEEEIYRDLSEPERRMMKLAALYRTPVPREALFGGPDLTYDVLLALQERALIRRVGEDAFEVHETIRDYFDSILTGSEKAALGRFAIDQLQALASHAESTGDLLSCVDCLSNALRLSEGAENRVALLEALGDADERLGNLPETLNAYKVGLALTTDSQRVARFHRKTARALLERGETGPASNEVDQGLEGLGEMRNVERGWLELLQGDIATDRENWGQALSCFRAAIEIFREFGEKHGEAEALLYLASHLMQRPEPDHAEGERMLQAASNLASSLADRRLLAEVHGELAAHHISGCPDVEKVMYHVAAQETAAGDREYFERLAAAWWRALAQMELLADFSGAEASLYDVATLAHRTYNMEASYLARYGLANVAYFRGDFAEARRRHEDLWWESRAARPLEFTWAREFTLESLWMAAECCMRQRDREGFERLAAELERPEVQQRITARVMVVHILRGISGLIDADKGRFETSFARGMSISERSLNAGEPPFLFLSFLVPYFYGIALRASGNEPEAEPFVSRALDTLKAYKLKARFDMLSRDQDRLVQVLREWAAAKTAAR